MLISNIKLFIVSFWIFFLLVVIMTIDIPICFHLDSEFIGFEALFSIRNTVAFACIILLLLGWLFFYQFNNALRGSLNLPVKIEELENINYEYFALLVPIVALIAFDFTSVRGVVLLVVLLFIFCAIFIKTELFYSNPSFALLGFHIYKADTNNHNLLNIVMITKSKLNQGDKVKFLKVSDKVYFTRKV